MASWNKIKFFYDSVPGAGGSIITATSSAPGNHVENIFNMLEVNRWEASSALSPQYITVDLGAGLEKGSDYLAVLGHNLNAAGASVTLQHSTDNFASDINDAFSPFMPASDKVILKEFAAVAPKRHWRLKVDGHTATPYMAVCVWGNKTELDYAAAGFDPHEQEARSNVNISNGGYVSGIHNRYTERAMSIRFEDADAPLYEKIEAWWETSGVKNFFVAWENADHPDDIFLMRPDARFNNPFKAGGLYRDINIKLIGRKE